MRKTNRHKGLSAGRSGEEAAARLLQKRGYRILVRNFRKAFAEVDIIARHKEVLVFIEVKTRSSLRYGAPVEAVHAEKQRRLSKIALDYMMQEGLHDQCARFDVVSVLLDRQGEVKHIEVFENAFDFVS